MPDLRDLHDAFSHLEQQIPGRYRSPLIEQRVAELTDNPLTVGGAAGRRRTRLAASVLAAAAVVALGTGVAIVVGSGGDHHGSHGTVVGTEPSTVPRPSRAVTSTPEVASNPTTTPATAAVSPSTSMPASSAALLTYVAGAKAVDLQHFQQGSAGSGQPLQATPGIAEFTTPSGNIVCGLTGSGSTQLTSCEVAEHSFATPPKPASCQNNWGSSWVSLQAGGVTRGLCLGGVPFDPINNTLPYGSTLTFGSVSCRSESAFLACADLTTGRGFAVDRSTLRSY